MKEKLYELQGFIEQSIQYEHEWHRKRLLEAKLSFIKSLLDPIDNIDIIKQFEREVL